MKQQNQHSPSDPSGGQAILPSRRYAGCASFLLAALSKIKERLGARAPLWGYLGAFLLPACILLLVYIGLGVYPFGERSLLTTDMSQIYVDLHSWLYDVLTGAQIPFFTWRGGLGMNMAGVWAFYLASPFSLLVLPFGKGGVCEALLLITLLKCGCCGLSFYSYGRRILRLNSLAGVTFSSLYALMGYVVVYALNIMWLDGVILLPLAVLALHRLWDEGRILPLLLGLFALFVTQFYIAYMVGLFLALYFFALAFARHARGRRFWGRLGRFTLCAALAAACAAFVLLPAYCSLRYSTPQLLAGDWERDTLSLFGLFSKLLYGSYDSLTFGLPNLYGGVLAVLLCPLYFLNTKITRREKLAAGALCIILVLSMAVWPLNLLWHAGDEPTWFPCRFSFLFTFCLIAMAARAFRRLNGCPRRYAAVSLGVVMVLTALLDAFGYSYFGTDLQLINLLLLGLYAGILGAMRRYSPKSPRMGARLACLLLCCVVLELYGNTAALTAGIDRQFGYQSRSSYTDFYQGAGQSFSALPSQEESWYRAENQQMRYSNDALSLGYNGLAHYSSFTNQHLTRFLDELGLSTRVQNRFLRYFGSTPVTDSLLGIRYVAAGEAPHHGYEALQSQGSLTFYENSNALPIAFLTNPMLLQLSNSADGDPFLLQNSMLELAVGQRVDCFSPVEGLAVTVSENLSYETEPDGAITLTKNTTSPGLISFTVCPEKSGSLYLSLSYRGLSDRAQVWVNGQPVASGGYTVTGVIAAGYYNAGEEATVLVEVTASSCFIERPLVYLLDEEALAGACTQLRQGGMTNIVQTANGISGTVSVPTAGVDGSATQNNLLFTSIPADPGWEVWVDDQPASTATVAGAFLAVSLPPGEHTVSFRFTPQGLLPGVILSLCGLFAAIILCLWFDRFYLYKKSNYRR